MWWRSPWRRSGTPAIFRKLPPVYPDMTVAEYLAFVARIKGVSRRDIKTRLDEIVEKCAVADVRNRQIGKLSKGYRQRVGLAQALIHNPDVLVLDEPTAGLDPKQIIETRELIKGLAGQHTVILSTHILPEVSKTCQRVVVINAGQIVAVGTPDELMRRLQGFETVLVTVEGPAAAIIEKFQRVGGVNWVEPRESQWRPGDLGSPLRKRQGCTRGVGARHRGIRLEAVRTENQRFEPGGNLPEAHHQGSQRRGRRESRESGELGSGLGSGCWGRKDSGFAFPQNPSPRYPAPTKGNAPCATSWRWQGRNCELTSIRRSPTWS